MECFVDDEEVVFELNGVFGVEDEENMVIHKRKLRASNLLYKCLREGTLTQRILLLTNFRELARLTLVRVITAFLLAQKTISRSLTENRLLIDRNEWNEIKSASSDISPPLKSKILRWYNNKSTNASKFVKKFIAQN